jgi:UDP-N-acetylmuramoyl-tripeptide--D-alanyl-D-alanine ligase
VIELSGERLAAAAGATAFADGPPGGATRVVIDSREVRDGDLFVGLPGERMDGGEFAGAALGSGAWGVLVGTPWANEIAAKRERGGGTGEGWVLGATDPLGALQSLARAWRRELGAGVIGITGSTGKTSVKDVCRAILPVRTHASRENFNTEIGLPLAILAAPPGTEALVLEMGMRGPGQIAELCEIAEPDVGVITNVGPVHVEMLGSIEAIAEAKAELIDGLTEEGTAVVPADPGVLGPHVSRARRRITFGEGGDVHAREILAEAGETNAVVVSPAGARAFKLPFLEAHNLDNALAAIAAGLALGLSLEGMARRAPGIVFSRLRGELVQLPGNAILVNDSYNANPVSMRAALDHLATLRTDGRRMAVLGDMLELGPGAAAHHREIGEHARDVGVSHLIGVGELAGAYEPDVHVPNAEAAAAALRDTLGPGDAVLVKGSRAVGLERVAEILSEASPSAAPRDGESDANG